MEKSTCKQATSTLRHPEIVKIRHYILSRLYRGWGLAQGPAAPGEIENEVAGRLWGKVMSEVSGEHAQVAILIPCWRLKVHKLSPTRKSTTSSFLTIVLN